MRQWFRIAIPKSYMDRQRRAGFLFILPALLFFGSVFIMPLAQSVVNSFYRTVPGGASQFVGFRLYEKVLTDSTFWVAIRNTVQSAAHVRADDGDLRAGRRARPQPDRQSQVAEHLGRHVLPALRRPRWSPPSLIWQWIYDPVYGFLNYFLAVFGIPPQKWLQSLAQVRPAIGRRQRLGAHRLRHHDLSGRAAIRPAGSITRRRASMGPAHGSGFGISRCRSSTHRSSWSASLNSSSTFKIFDQVYATTQGGPASASQTVIMLLYDTAFKYFRFGDASVMAVFVFVTLLVVTLLQWRIFRKPVEY